MTDVDETTGMPTPPEGLFWRVKKESTFDGYNYYTGTPCVEIQLIRVTEGHKKIKRSFLWFDWTETSKEVTRNEEVVERLTVYETITKGEKQKDVVVNPRFLTSLQVFETAQQVLARYHQAEKAKALLGDYPPKKLDEVNNGSEASEAS